MKKKLLYIFGVLIIATAVFGASVNIPTPNYNNTQVLPLLKVDVEKDTKEVHFINTNNDPDILTKTYVLKHADPYEIRPYLKSAVDSRRVDSSETKIEAIKYEDGTNILIVSAEDYRFEKQENGMSIDEIIESLDQPKISSSSGHKLYLYFPKYWDSSTLARIITEVGLVNNNSPYELQGGKDRVSADTGLNALFFYTPAFSIKTVEEMLKLYDTPTFEALITYTIYEMDYENDGNIGVDFQAWKNGPGADLFSVASRFADGWDFVNEAVNRSYIKNAHTEYINFSPKWNTKYLDFLVAKSKAKVVSSGILSIMNNQQGYIRVATEVPDVEDGSKLSDRASIMEYQRLSNASWDDGTGAVAGNNNNYRINNATDKNNNPIALTRADGTAVNANIDFVISRSTVGENTYYYMEVGHNDDAWFFDVAGKNLGKSVKCYDADLQRLIRTSQGVSNGNVIYSYAWTDQTNWQTDYAYNIMRDVTRETVVHDYGFELAMTPIVCEEATTLDIEMSNTSLIGFRDDGGPRQSKSDIRTTVMVSNKGQKFVIGGLEKKTSVSSVNKVPWLGSIPVLGWAFSGESETIKTSQLVAVIECIPIMPETRVPSEVMSTINGIKEKVENSGIKYGVIEQDDYGFDQFLLDSEKTSLAPLP